MALLAQRSVAARGAKANSRSRVVVPSIRAEAGEKIKVGINGERESELCALKVVARYRSERVFGLAGPAACRAEGTSAARPQRLCNSPPGCHQLGP
jgi:hypothetical protein